MSKGLDPLALATRATQQQKNRLSVKSIGVGLTGLGAVNQRIPVDMATKQLLIAAVKNLGAVKIETSGDTLYGKPIEMGTAKTWTDKLDKLAAHLDEKKPSYFVLFRQVNDCLIITYVPDLAKPQKKMLYASNKESVKDALMELDPNMNLEEYNVAEVSDLSSAQYEKKTAIPKPYSEAEILRQEQDKAETAGGYGMIARINAAGPGHLLTGRPMSLKTGDADAKPVALAGLSGGFDPKSLRASLRPIGKTKIPASGAAKSQFVQRGKSSFSAVKDEHYDNVMKKFGVNDREKRARVELDTILAGVEDEVDENLPAALRKKNDLEVDLSILQASSPQQATGKTTASEAKDKAPAPVQETQKKPKKPNIFVRLFGFLLGKKKPKPSSHIEDLV